MEQAEYWFGSFSHEQEALIRKASDARPLNQELKLAQRIEAQRNLIRMLKRIQTEKPDRDAVVALIRNHLDTSLALPGGAEYQAFLDASRDTHARMTRVILGALTAAQKDHADKRLQSWIDTFQEQSKLAQGA